MVLLKKKEAMGFLEDRDLSNVPTIPEYYKGKTLLITGGSGFMGKVLIEKLLYSCTELERIYLLLRNKKDVKSEDRLQAIYSTQCFDRLRKERPGVFESKVFVIAGDVSEIGLGISEEDRALLVNRVNIIFHVAASVRFDDPLAVAARLNLRGTREVVELAKDVRFLEALIHVSTSYANTNRDPVEEIMYPPHADWRETLMVCEETDEHTLKVLTPKYLGELPNTYTFTKQLAEHVVYEQKGKLPVVIIRPSIVISSFYEPVPGWIENFNGPVGIFVASGKGILRSIYSNPNLAADYIPVDIAIKGFIAAAWIRGTKALELTDDIPVYNSCAGNLNKVSISELVDLGRNIVATMPLNNALWRVGGSITTSKVIHYIKVLILHLLPALLVDFVLWILGKKPLDISDATFVSKLAQGGVSYAALQIYAKNILTLATRRSYQLKVIENPEAYLHCEPRSPLLFNTAMDILQQKFCKTSKYLKEEDLKNFYYQIENIDKSEFFKVCIRGGEHICLKKWMKIFQKPEHIIRE